MNPTPRTALVTGANRGLGLETCRQLARRSWNVILTSRSDQGREAAHRLSEETPKVEFRRLDVGDPSSVEEMAESLRREKKPLDTLVNNAGVYIEDLSKETAAKTLEINFFGPMRVTGALMGIIPDGGNIVMVSSGLGELTGFSSKLRERLLDPRLGKEALVELMRSFIDDVAAGRHERNGWPPSAYKVSKAGLNALTRVLSRELAGRSIRVNSVCPGWVRTDMGGLDAERTIDVGAASIVWAATLEDGKTGGFFRDGRPIPW